MQTEKRGREVLHSTNEKRREVRGHYSEVRVSNLGGGGVESFDLMELTRFLLILSGLYDPASRAATSL